VAFHDGGSGHPNSVPVVAQYSDRNFRTAAEISEQWQKFQNSGRNLDFITAEKFQNSGAIHFSTVAVSPIQCQCFFFQNSDESYSIQYSGSKSNSVPVVFFRTVARAIQFSTVAVVSPIQCQWFFSEQ
jgi:hypothetical protein